MYSNYKLHQNLSSIIHPPSLFLLKMNRQIRPAEWIDLDIAIGQVMKALKTKTPQDIFRNSDSFKKLLGELYHLLGMRATHLTSGQGKLPSFSPVAGLNQYYQYPSDPAINPRPCRRLNLPTRFHVELFQNAARSLPAAFGPTLDRLTEAARVRILDKVRSLSLNIMMPSNWDKVYCRDPSNIRWASHQPGFGRPITSDRLGLGKRYRKSGLPNIRLSLSLLTPVMYSWHWAVKSEVHLLRWRSWSGQMTKIPMSVTIRHYFCICLSWLLRYFVSCHPPCDRVKLQFFLFSHSIYR